MTSRPLAAILLTLFLLPVVLAAAPDLVILLRHAEKEAMAADNPHLNTAGRERAAALKNVVEALTTKIPVRAIFTTEFLRTRETAAPLAADLHIVPIATNGDIIDKVLAIHGGTVVIVGHSNTVPGFIAALGGPAGTVIGDAEFDHLYVVAAPGTPQTKFAALTYGER